MHRHAGKGKGMDVSVSAAGLVNLQRPRQDIKGLWEAGIESLVLDYGVFAYAGHIGREGYRPDHMRRYYERFLAESKGRGMKLPVAKAPFMGVKAEGRDLNGITRRLDKDCVRACEEAGCKSIIVQPLFLGLDRRKAWEANRGFYLELAGQCRDRETRILLINQYGDLNGKPVRGLMSEGGEAARRVDELNDRLGMERFGFCLDVGYCNLCGQDVQAFVEALGNRLGAVILKENDGRVDVRRLPFTEGFGAGAPCADWLGLIRGLRNTGFDGHLILEPMETVLTLSPLLRPYVLPLVKAVGDYFVMQVGIENMLKKYQTIALFGAGNMCRNYMKCYGEKYPPLFTCDNNRDLWGGELEGLKIKSPEALRELPEGSGVIICNTYYREIEEQLRCMEIENIGYFNDEYMPSFYFDRLAGDIKDGEDGKRK